MPHNEPVEVLRPGVSAESEFVRDNAKRACLYTRTGSITWHRLAVTSTFHDLKKKWKTQTWHFSSAYRASLHPDYRKIVAMDWDVVPTLIQDMLATKTHWFFALSEITGVDPVSEENRGYIDLMIKDWEAWAIKERVI